MKYVPPHHPNSADRVCHRRRTLCRNLRTNTIFIGCSRLYLLQPSTIHLAALLSKYMERNNSLLVCIKAEPVVPKVLPTHTRTTQTAGGYENAAKNCYYYNIPYMASPCHIELSSQRKRTSRSRLQKVNERRISSSRNSCNDKSTR